MPFLVLALCGTARGQDPDSAAVFRAARTAEAEYERAARRLAPLGSNDRSGSCDEFVGRFCLYYDAGRDPLPAEPIEITRSRERALARIQAAFDLNPARVEAALPLVRLLLEHKQPAQARAAAERFSRSSTDSVTAWLLRTLTLHANREIPEAERAAAVWLAAADSAERRRLTDLRWLLEPREEKRYRALTREAAVAYEARFWRYADALYLTPGNEVLTEHFARHAESRLARSAPTVLGSTSWGDDLAELTIRFGTPKARTQRWPPRIGSSEPEITEHWDPEQRIYAAPALDSVLKVRARPGMGWPMDTVRSISGHAPTTFRRMLPMEHQATVFRNPAGEMVLRIDGVLRMDTATTRPAHYGAGLFVLDPALNEVGRRVSAAASPSDSLVISLELPLPPEAQLYSAEILESGTRLAGRARFAVDRPAADRGLFLSDLLVAEPFPAGELPTTRTMPGLVAKRSLILPTGRPFGIYAEVDLAQQRPDTVRVELELRAANGTPAVVRAARWLGKRLGLANPAPPRRLTWSAETTGAGPTAVAVTIDPGNLKPGRYIIEMAAGHAGRRVTARKEVVFSDSATSSRQP